MAKKERRHTRDEENVGWNPRPPSRSGKVANSFARFFASSSISRQCFPSSSSPRYTEDSSSSLSRYTLLFQQFVGTSFSLAIYCHNWMGIFFPSSPFPSDHVKSILVVRITNATGIYSDDARQFSAVLWMFRLLLSGILMLVISVISVHNIEMFRLKILIRSSNITKVYFVCSGYQKCLRTHFPNKTSSSYYVLYASFP